MPKVLAYDSTLSNAEVLSFLKKKRVEHAREDAEDTAAGKTPAPRPKNLMTSLEKHERHLKSDNYPYEKNPSAYGDKGKQNAAHEKFAELYTDRVHTPAFEALKEKVRMRIMTEGEGQEKWNEDVDRREFTENEWLMLHNHAPTTVELLQPMIEQSEERFTYTELETIVECIKETYRADEFCYTKENHEEPAEEDAKQEPTGDVLTEKMR